MALSDQGTSGDTVCLLAKRPRYACAATRLGRAMRDDTNSLFIVVIALTTLSMPSVAQPAFAAFGLALGLLAHRATGRNCPIPPATREHPTSTR
ncbi:MAG TPA: hypothetical protein VFA63_19665 [Pseudonocardiaceae bacterium]|nr:hypothetical protein [Pseudonocardiaceae bacterium]